MAVGFAQMVQVAESDWHPALLQHMILIVTRTWDVVATKLGVASSGHVRVGVVLASGVTGRWPGQRAVLGLV
jgi:hypothetical protein